MESRVKWAKVHIIKTGVHMVGITTRIVYVRSENNDTKSQDHKGRLRKNTKGRRTILMDTLHI